MDEYDYEEIHWNEGDLVILDPMCTHSGSSNGGGVPARYVLFTAMFHPAAIGTTLAGLENRTAVTTHTTDPQLCPVMARPLLIEIALQCITLAWQVSPAWKYPECMRETMLPELKPVLDWVLPDAQPDLQPRL